MGTARSALCINLSDEHTTLPVAALTFFPQLKAFNVFALAVWALVVNQQANSNKVKYSKSNPELRAATFPAST